MRQEWKQALKENNKGKKRQLCQRHRQTTVNMCLETFDLFLDMLSIGLYIGSSHSIWRDIIS